MSILKGMHFDTLTGREIIALRTANEKHFDLGQGRRQAVIFSSPVHYKNAKTGTWDEIDNRLVEKTDAKGRRFLENKAGLFRARFFENTHDGSFVSLKANDTEFAWSYPGASVSAPAHVSKRMRRSFDSERERRRKVVDRLNDDVLYESLFPGMSVRLTVDELGVKEDIILENAEAVRHAVLELPEGFTYVKNADESVSVLKDGKLTLTIDAPFTYDANMTILPTYVALEPQGGVYMLRYEVDKTAIASAVFPVTIDPRVSFTGESSAIETTNITDRDKTAASYTEYMTVGTTVASNEAPSSTYITLCKFTSLVNRKASDTILSAHLHMSVAGSPDVNDIICAYPMKGAWEHTNATWNSVHADTDTYISNRIQSYVHGTNTSECAFDITDIYNSWYEMGDNNQTKNFGIALARPRDNSGACFVTFYGSKISVASLKPYVVVDYVSHAGVKGWWTYETLSCGRAGSANIDLFNGNLVAHHADTATVGSRMPVSVQHVYNSCQSLSDEFGCGLGWRTSLHQTVREETIASAAYYVWQDGEGTDHFFERSGSQPYSDCEGMQLKMTAPETDTPSITDVTITDKGGTVMLFEDAGASFRLKSVTDAHGNAMTLTYTADGKLYTVTDGIGRNTTFHYISGLLYGIDAPGCPSLEFEYAQTSGGYNLAKIFYADLPSDTNSADYKYSEYTYEGSMLTGMKNFDGCELALSYQALDAEHINNYTLQSRRVKDIEFKNGTVKGTKKVFAYGHMRTDVTHMENDTTGKKISYHFNSSGNVVDTNDEMWYTHGTKYDSGIENTPGTQGRTRRAVVNHLVNADFSSDWTQTKEYSSDTYSIDSSVTCLAMRSAKIVKKGAGEFKSASVAKLFKSGNYTFSAYVKTSGLTVASGKKGAFIRVTDGANVYESEAVVNTTANREMNTFASGWERVYVTFPFTRDASLPVTTASDVTVSIVCDASVGTVYFAAPQVESGEIANLYNLVVNGDFSVTKANNALSAGTRYFPENWTILGSDLTKDSGLSMQTGVVFSRDENDMPENVEGNALRLYSALNARYISMAQSIVTYGNKDDVLVLGGWANSHTVQAGHELSRPAVCIRFLNAADSQWTSWVNYMFTTENDSWHHMSVAVAAPVAYARIEIGVSYPRNTETCMFSHIYLHRDLYGTSFTYDENGNVVSVRDISNQQSQAEYDDFDNLLSYVQPGSASSEKYVFTYGTEEAQKKRHLPMTSETPMGVKSATTYDDYGNSIANIVQPAATEPLMKTETVYTSNGNYVLRQKDARGNIVTNTVDGNGKVTAVTDPAGNSIHYEYDDSNRVTAVLFEKDDPNNSNNKIQYKNNYEYVNDRLTKISHNTEDNDCDVEYNFEYDALGRKKKVKVGNATLSENVYSNDRRGLLEEMHFGNDAKVRYEYDDFGRTTAIYVDEPGETTTAPKYEFKYDARGIASVIKDNVLMTETRVTCDLADRPSESVTRDANGNLVHKSVLNYDGKNRVKEFIDVLPESAHKTEYTYDADNRVTEVKYDNSDTHKVNYSYDLLNRITTKTVTNGVPYSTTYGYLASDTVSYGTNITTPLIETITHGADSNSIEYSYIYDSRGYIISEKRIVENAGLDITISYEYDEYGQLTRVNDPNDKTAGIDGTTWVYAYDRGGNMVKRIQYGYTTGELVTSGNTREYFYNTGWKDQLIFDGTTPLTYDDVGNLKNYDGWTYEWEAGHLLKRQAKNRTVIAYDYDSNGMRTRKTVSNTDALTSVAYDYIYSGTKLIHMTKNSDSLYFYYDSQGRLATVSYNGETYTYLQNLQGDIVGILDSTGVLVVEYKYDAWGMIIDRSGTMADTLGYLNPFCYRGYIYDDETGMFWLRSRYYYPKLCRFINADKIISSDNIISNIYCYCQNQPINKTDDNGTSPIAIAGGWLLSGGWQTILATLEACVDYVGKVVALGTVVWGISEISGTISQADSDIRTEVDVVPAPNPTPTTKPSPTPKPNSTLSPNSTPNPDNKYFVAIAYGKVSPVIVSPPMTKMQVYHTLHVANMVDTVIKYVQNSNYSDIQRYQIGVYTPKKEDAYNLAVMFGLNPRLDLSEGLMYSHFNVDTPGFKELHFWFHH